MGTRLELQSKLIELLGSKHVYYQPPESVKIEYPAIVYSKNNLRITRADDSVYSKRTQYEIIVIDKKPDNKVIEELLSLPYCSYDRHYTFDNLNHDILTLYY